jgi:hypothetical protein
MDYSIQTLLVLQLAPTQCKFTTPFPILKAYLVADPWLFHFFEGAQGFKIAQGSFNASSQCF